jgi:hypothetical protein
MSANVRELELGRRRSLRSPKSMSRSPIKGIAKARRDAFAVARSVEYLSRGAEEALFQIAEVMSEGSERSAPSGQRHYYGSTMITFDLAELSKVWRGPFGPRERAALLRLVAGSVRVRLRATRIACAEAQRRVTERPLGSSIVETTVRLSGNTLQMDVDLEVLVGVFSPLRRAP